MGAWTLAQTLDTAMTIDTRYEWHMVDDMVVVRPKSAWTDGTDPLNRLVRNLRVSDRSLADVILAVRDFLYTNRLDVKKRTNVPGLLSFFVGSGTVVDVLNGMTAASDGTMWTAFADRVADTANGSHWDLVIDVRSGQHVAGFLGSRQAAVAGAR